MSDDLVKRLRDIQGQAGLFASAAADRIKALTAERDDLKAKLAKAVEALEQIASHRKKCHEYDDDVGHERREFDVEDMIIMEYAARTTLAELTGETT